MPYYSSGYRTGLPKAIYLDTYLPIHLVIQPAIVAIHLNTHLPIRPVIQPVIRMAIHLDTPLPFHLVIQPVIRLAIHLDTSLPFHLVIQPAVLVTVFFGRLSGLAFGRFFIVCLSFQISCMPFRSLSAPEWPSLCWTYLIIYDANPSYGATRFRMNLAAHRR